MTTARCLFVLRHRTGGPDHRCPWHTHPCTELVLVEEGDCVLHQGGRSRRIGGGQLIVSRPEQSHRVDAESSSLHLCVGIAGCGAERLEPGARPCPEAAAARFREIMRADGARRDLLAGLLALDLSDPAAVVVEAEPSDAAEQAMRLIETDFNAIAGTRDLATRVGLSADHLRELFHRRYREPPLKALNRRRIEVAAQLLSSDSRSLADIAATCGFNDPAYFSRMFRRLRGVAPSSLRPARMPKLVR
ncbi:MAG: helix-turn-helix domain-containing protein [Planctomycetes bacterium]|nr:helix-turn-helix domain-containing protein [Planctomycetota bacterium]